jgi:hypothetical protein
MFYRISYNRFNIETFVGIISPAVGIANFIIVGLAIIFLVKGIKLAKHKKTARVFIPIVIAFLIILKNTIAFYYEMGY